MLHAECHQFRSHGLNSTTWILPATPNVVRLTTRAWAGFRSPDSLVKIMPAYHVTTFNCCLDYHHVALLPLFHLTILNEILIHHFGEIEKANPLIQFPLLEDSVLVFGEALR